MELFIRDKSQTSSRNIYLLLLFVAVLWGTNVVMIKYLTHFYPPTALAPIRLFLATCLLIPIVLCKHGIQPLPKQAWLPIFSVALFAIFLHQITLSVGLASTSGSHAAVILGLNPLITSILTRFYASEQFTWINGASIALGFCGVILITVGNTLGEATVSGDLIVLFSTFSVAVGYLCVKKSTAYLSPLSVTVYSHVIGSTALVVFGFCVNPVWSYGNIDGYIPIVVLLFSSFVNTAMGAIWWNTGIKQVGASRTSLFLNCIPVTGLFASVFFLGDSLNWNHYLALIFVVLSVSLGTGILDVRALVKKVRSRWRRTE